MQKHIASVSFGKDSLCMLFLLLVKGYPLDEVVFYDTGMEFQAIYNTRDAILPLLAEKGIKYTELKPKYDFCWKMFDKLVKNRDGSGFHCGYSWCGGTCRWGTADKLAALDEYSESQNAIVYIGIAADETMRIQKEREPYKRLPLVEWHMTEKECLELCYKRGFTWLEGDYRLYDLLDRVSCWCCANKNLKELRNIYWYLPAYFNRLKELQGRTDRPMKGAGKSVFDLERRFEFEMRRIEQGKSITNREFHRELAKIILGG